MSRILEGMPDPARVEAARAEGLKVGFYYSLMDWHHPDYLPRREWDKRPIENANFSRYVEYMKGQVGELVQNYDPDLMWFDGDWEDTWTSELGWDMYDSAEVSTDDP